MSEITGEDITKLFTYFSKNLYRASDTNLVSEDVLEKCISLVKLDYSCFLVSNRTGELSAHYPAELIILENELQNPNGNSNGPTNGTIYESPYDKTSIRDMIYKARTARCRARFPVPVILYKGKYVCRSATLAGGPELYTRNGIDYFFNNCEPSDDTEDDHENASSHIDLEDVSNTTDQGLFDSVRRSDINYLKILDVSTIVDFMVEKKKVKFGLYVTSSEKVDKENRYQDFTIVSLPYPGCEFFKQYRDHNYTAKGLVFNWEQSYVDADIGVPPDLAKQLKIEWNKYKQWDLITITQNYLKVLIRFLQESASGLLLHCISGWDRTPLFVSLLRISLWADGVIHQHLSPQQILYLTIAYDWMLFGHNLADRLVKGEDIFHFCFNILKFIVDEEFSILASSGRKSKLSNGGSTGSTSTVVSSGNNSSTSSIAVISEGQIEGLMLEDTRGSDISLNSTCSSSSTRDNETPPVWFKVDSEDYYYNNGNGPETYSPPPVPRGSPYASPHQRRTSPIAVPPRIRHRNESPSSVISTGSWQMITDTGSLRSSNSNLDVNGRIDQLNTSSCTVMDEDTSTLSFIFPEALSLRKNKINSVRQLFITHYSQIVGLQFKTTDTLSNLFGNIVEKVGLTTKS